MGRDKPKKREKIYLLRNRFYLNQAREFRKKFKNLKNIILASFQAETGQDRPKKSEKKFLDQNCFFSTRAREFRKKKFQKIEIHHPGFISSRNGLEQAKKERKNFSRSEPFLPNPS